MVQTRAQVNHKGVEKYIFHCFGDECCPKWDSEKLTIVSFMQYQSLYTYRDLLAHLWYRLPFPFSPKDTKIMETEYPDA